MSEKITVLTRAIHGTGIFAHRTIMPRETVGIFSGSKITLEQSIERRLSEDHMLQIDKNLYLDVDPPLRFTNHSCEPNAGICRDGRTLVALHTIQSGEEISFDYSTTMDEEKWELYPCRCASATCRGRIGDFKYLPNELQRKYLLLDVVPEFIRQYTTHEIRST